VIPCTIDKLIIAALLLVKNLDKIIVRNPANPIERYGTSKTGNLKAIIAEDKPSGSNDAKTTTIGFSSISKPRKIRRRHASKRTPKEIVKKIIT
jgi:hypothetical protein